LSALFLILFIYALIKTQGTNRGYSQITNFDLLFSLALVSSLLISPLGWSYYFTLLIIPLVISWQVVNFFKSNILRIMVVIAWILTTIPFQHINPSEFSNLQLFTIGNIYSIGLLLFFVILLFSVSRFSYYKIESLSTLSADGIQIRMKNDLFQKQ
jgi:hypothetical protein